MLNWKRDLDSLINLVSNVADAFSATLFLLDESRTLLNVVSFHTLSRCFLKDVSIEIGHGLIGRVAQSGELVNVSELHRETKAIQYYGDEENIKSFLAVPVIPRETIGVLAMDSKRQFDFTPKTQKIVAGFAEQFHRIISYHGLPRQSHDGKVRALLPLMDFNRKLCSGLERSEILDLLGFTHREIIHCDGAAVVLKDEGEDENEYRIARAWGDSLLLEGDQISRHQGLVGWILQNARPLNLQNLKGYDRRTFIFFPSEPELKIRSFLGVPLVFRGELLGALAFIGREPNIFTDYHEQMAILIAGQASLALLQAKMQNQWKTLGHQDAATGFLNYRSFKQMLEDVLPSLQKKGRVYLVMVEPDRTARLDALRGLPSYDEVIRRIARILRGTFSHGDYLARSMDEGFILLINRSDSNAAEKSIERAKRAIEEAVFSLDKGAIQVTVSIGLFPLVGGKEDVTELLAGAWAAFQSAKKVGANRTWHFDSARMRIL